MSRHRAFLRSLSWVTTVVAGTLLALAGPAIPTFAQASACSSSVKSVDDSPFGYRQRGDRCEGIYWQPHAGPSGEIAVLSLLSGSPQPSAVSAEPWRVAWPTRVANAEDRVQLQATSLRRGLYYRMDALTTLRAGRFDWATDVLRGLSLRGDQVSLHAETRVKISGVTWPVFLPVWIGAAPTPANADLRLQLTSTTSLYVLAWECLRLSATGMPGATVAKGKREGPFKANEPFTLTLDLAGFSGLCYLDVRGEAVVKPPSGDPTASLVIWAPGSADADPQGTRR